MWFSTLLTLSARAYFDNKMYLKNLTVLGFKSFANKTSLNFEPGVTAIVGPNGCGKSNVSDAIRWVLGEQSAKALRGGEMADVIFNGTDGRKALGMAEVSLTIGDVDEEHLTAAGVAVAYNEITITRRVFKDGGSEYFINKTPCRLKDVQQLFMGTGVGRTSYSIMAQGNITQILSSKPEDRRMIFEEAAGITKFKAQKKESLRKLEYTEQNLLRIADLIKEVKRQIGSLQRQAGKARRYKQLMMDLQHLETQLARHQFDLLQGEIASKEKTVESLRVSIEESSSAVLQREDEIVQLRGQLSALDRECSEMQQRGLELKSQVEREQGRIHYNEERLNELTLQNSKALADITEAEQRLHTSEQDSAAIISRLESARVEVDKQKGELQQRRDTVQAAEKELQQLQERQRQIQSQSFGHAQQLARARNEINTLDLQKQGNIVRLEKLSAEKIQLEEERVQLEAKLVEFQNHVDAEKLSAQTHRGTVEERQARLKEIHSELSRLTSELDVHLRQQAEKRSRLNVLEQLESGHEGFSSGALAAMKSSSSVLGSLADKIRVPDRYIVAIEAALGHNLQLVITEHPEAATSILADLTQNKKGRASIAPLSFARVFFGEAPLATSIPYPTAVSVMEVQSEMKPLLESLLGRTLIVPDLGAATQSWKETNGAYDYVTETGEILTRLGIYTGGSGSGNGSGKAPNSILGRKNQIAELAGQIETAQVQVNELSKNKGSLLSEQTALQASLQEAQASLRQQEVAIATHQGEFNALHNSKRILHQKCETVGFELQNLAKQEEEGIAKRSGLAEKISVMEQQEKSLQDETSEILLTLDTRRTERDQLTSQLTEIKVSLASGEQVCASLQGQSMAVQQRIRELTSLLTQRKSEVSDFLGRKQQAEADIEGSNRQIEQLQATREQVSEQTIGLLEQKSAQETDIASREDQLRDNRRQLGEAQQQRGALEVELAQRTMSVQNLREKILQKYHLNLDDVRSECITITYADEGPAKVHTLTPEEMAAGGASTDWNAVGEQVVSLQKKLDEIGPVNLVAIEEYEETEQRHNFLSSQYEDLVSAKAQLMDVINKINLQTRQMFTETFEKIRDNFRILFTEVFGGGKADLILVGDGDALESGIEIVARPPGKQLQTISLLSGGEQTMTAVSLLFSIYQVKPSPFCVLDELDAPLDESNINRFVKVLQRFLDHSQFIVITHNKRTIAMADVLYGVTMEEHGVSKIVSVKFHKTGETAPAKNTTTDLVPGTESESLDRNASLSSGNGNGDVTTGTENNEIVMAK